MNIIKFRKIYQDLKNLDYSEFVAMLVLFEKDLKANSITEQHIECVKEEFYSDYMDADYMSLYSEEFKEYISNYTSPLNNKKELIDILKEFVKKEYDGTLDTHNYFRIPVMYTELQKDSENIKVQLYVDIVNYNIFITYNNIECYKESYSTYNVFKKVLESLDFDSYMQLDNIILLEYYTQKIKRLGGEQ